MAGSANNNMEDVVWTREKEEKRQKGSKGGCMDLYPSPLLAECTASTVAFIGDKGDASTYANKAGRWNLCPQDFHSVRPQSDGVGRDVQ